MAPTTRGSLVFVPGMSAILMVVVMCDRSAKLLTAELSDQLRLRVLTVKVANEFSIRRQESRGLAGRVAGIRRGGNKSDVAGKCYSIEGPLCLCPSAVQVLSESGIAAIRPNLH